MRRLGLPLILGVSLALNLSYADFPYAFHGDEPSKVTFIRTGTQNFNHPILMLQLVRAANAVLGLTDEQRIAELGRLIMGVCGTLTVLLSYALARRTMRAGSAAAVALAVAASPLLVVHAHYLKEDTLLTTWLMASAFCFLTFAERLDARSTLLLGLTTGLAFSSHYKSILLVPLYLVAPLLRGLRIEAPAQWARRLIPRLALAGVIAAVVFLTVNWPLLVEPLTFRRGMQFELEHAQAGHDIPIVWSDYWLGFHIVNSLIPGMGTAAALLGLAGLLVALARWRSAPLQDRWLLAFVLVFYLVPELSPLKPWPDFSRYMIPVVPPLLYFAWQGVERVAGTAALRQRATWVYAAALAALVLVPAYTSVRLSYGLTTDTRVAAGAWLIAHGGNSLREQYAVEPTMVRTLASVDLAEARAQGVDYLVASSFMYERFAIGAALPGKDPEVYETHARYVELFTRPYVEIAPAYRTFAFSNPVIRIIDIRESAVD